MNQNNTNRKYKKQLIITIVVILVIYLVDNQTGFINGIIDGFKDFF